MGQKNESYLKYYSTEVSIKHIYCFLHLADPPVGFHICQKLARGTSPLVLRFS